MTRTDFCITVKIPTPPRIVWSVISDVARWPEWTSSISRIKALSPGPLQVGSRVRIYQPRLPPVLWRVTELAPGVGFTWVNRAPGVRVTARHAVQAIANGTQVTLSIHYAGLLGRFLARWVGDLNGRYLAMEANGLKARCTEIATKNCIEHQQIH